MSYEKRWKGKKTDDPKVIRGKRKRQESDVKDYDKEEIIVEMKYTLIIIVDCLKCENICWELKKAKRSVESAPQAKIFLKCNF